jgi:hypothetical protein
MTTTTNRELLAHSNYRILDSLKRRVDEETLADLRERVWRALEDFDALAGETVTVGCRRQPENTNYSRGWNPYASAEPVNRIIRVPTHERCSDVTLYHELAHLAIHAANENGAEHPETSERFCSLYAIARQPPDRIDEQRIPYFGQPEPPEREWPGIAQEALAYREENHDYIQEARRMFGLKE